VRRAKLYYLRGRSGRASRIKERAEKVRPAKPEPIEEAPVEVAIAETSAPVDADGAQEQPVTPVEEAPAEDTDTNEDA